MLLLKVTFRLILICGTPMDGAKEQFFFFLENIQWKSCRNIAETCRLMNGCKKMSKNQLLAFLFGVITWGYKTSQRIPGSKQMREERRQLGACDTYVSQPAVTFWAGVAVRLPHPCVLWMPPFGLPWGRMLNRVGPRLGLPQYRPMMMLYMCFVQDSPQLFPRCSSQPWPLPTRLLRQSGCSTQLSWWFPCHIRAKQHPEMGKFTREHQHNG